MQKTGENGTMTMNEKTLDDIYTLAQQEFSKEGHEVHVVELLGPYLKKRQEHGVAWLLYGEALGVIGRYKEAMTALLKALELAPSKEKSYIYGKLGFLCHEYKSPVEAEKWYELAVKNETEPVDWLYIFRGTNLSMLGLFDESLVWLNKAANMESEVKDEIFVNIGFVYRAMGKYNEAIAAFNQALEFDHDNQEAKVAIEGLLNIGKY